MMFYYWLCALWEDDRYLHHYETSYTRRYMLRAYFLAKPYSWKPGGVKVQMLMRWLGK